MEKGQDIQPIPATELADTEVPNSDQEYVTRKRRPRRKTRSMTVSIRNGERGVEPPNCTVNSREGFNENGAGPTNSNVIYGVPVADDSEIILLYDNIQTESFKVSKDSEMKAPPEINEPPTPERMKECESNSENERVNENVNSLPMTNKKALPITSRTYELEKFEKHALLIFNQENIVGYNRPRLGTTKDVEELKRTFTNFGFEITEKHDLKKDEIMKTLEEFSSQDFTDYGCVAVAVLTHGSSNGLIRAKDKPYSELEIINNFKVDRRPTLVTKPKIVIIQACRGCEDLAGTHVNSPTKAKTQKDYDEEVEPYTLPVESDMLIVHSSFKGKQSHRHEKEGSWFIQTLCKKINELGATQDLQSILTDMKREVAIDFSDEEYNRRSLEFDINKQMPVTTSTLIRKLYLKKFNDQSSSVPTVIPSTAKDKTVLDSASSPGTPMLIQFSSCYCFLEHYEYMKNCMKMYVENHPNDSTALSFYSVACTLKNGIEFYDTKEKILHAMSLHLSSLPDSQRLRYLHPYVKKQ